MEAALKLEEEEYVNLRQALEKAQYELQGYPDYSSAIEMIELALVALNGVWNVKHPREGFI